MVLTLSLFAYGTLHIGGKPQQHSRNVDGLIHRCGGGFANPFGDSTQYRPGEGRATFTKTAKGPIATRIYDGTTYYGGQTGVVSGTTRILSATAIVNGTWIAPGTTTWVSGTPGIIRGISSRRTGTRTCTGSVIPTGTETIIRTRTRTRTHTVGKWCYHHCPTLSITTQGISGGAIAGSVLGILGAAVISGLLALCWRSERDAHTALSSTRIAHEPTRTTVVEKIEPVVVKSVPATETYHASSVPVAGAFGTAYGANTGHSGAAYNTGNSYNAGNNSGVQHPAQSLNV
ncbi:hypothetical protein BG003_011775 [Podila horticola]|nr:hypothetical protein BG003_011775 [Podila horticola]